MKLGGEILARLFQASTWRAYRGNDLMPWVDIEPLIGPNSIDVSLSNIFLTPKANGRLTVDPRNENALVWEKIVVGDGESLVLDPGSFILGAVRERFVCEEQIPVQESPLAYVRQALFAPMYEGRSSCGRLGLASHITAGFGDYGFGGAFTLELYNHFPYALILHPGMRIGQVAFEEVYRPKRYQGAYSGENHHDGPVPPKLGPGRF
jgi:dCTP deaminase